MLQKKKKQMTYFRMNPTESYNKLTQANLHKKEKRNYHQSVINPKIINHKEEVI